MILDQYGKPIDLAGLRAPQTDSLPAVSSLRREFDEHPGRGLTPASLNAILGQAEQGDIVRQLELADDMEERDTQIYSELAKRKTALTTLEWDVEPPEDASADEQKLADEVREWVRGIPDFEETILLELMDAVLKGFKPIEMWWQLEERVLLPRFAPRPQRWLCLNEDRDQLTLRVPGMSYGEPLRPMNWLLHQHRSRNGYLARGSLVRVLAWPYLYRNYATRDLAEFLEIYGLPARIGKYPTGASEDEKRKLLQAVVSIGHNAAGIIPQAMALDFQNAAQGNEGPFKVQIDLHEAAISKAILGQTLTSGEGQHGTQALGNVHNEVRLDILKSDARRVAGTLTSQLIAPMVLLNKPGVDRKRLPRFTIDVPEPEDLRLYADALPKLASAGMRIGVKDMHRRLRIPEAEAGEEILRGAAAPAAPGQDPNADPRPGEPAKPGAKPAGTPPGAPAAPPAPAAPAPARTKTALAAATPVPSPAASPAPDAFDDLVAEAAGAWRPTLQPLVGPLLDELQRAVAAGESLEAFAARLPELVQRMDYTPLGERLARAAFAARLAGVAGLDLSNDQQDA